MADSASLLDEELSSFVFSYLTETSGSQYGEEEVCSDRLDADFSDIDLSQLDTSDFDSVNCLSELQWCSDQQTDASPASIHYSTADELFETEEENAALLAALTDSLDGMVDAEVGGLSVFPTLEGEEPVQDDEEEEEENLPLSSGDLGQVLGAESEDPSLLRKLLLSPPNLPAGIDAHKDRVRTHRYSNRSLHLRPVRNLVKSDVIQERKPRAVRPAGHLCTELHRHLTTAQDPESNPAPDTEEDEEDEDEEETESEEDEEEEEEDSSSSEVEGATLGPSEPLKPQFSSEKEMHAVVELITYMHTYCLPTRKQQSWERRDRDLQRSRARPDASRHTATNSHTRVVLVTAPGSAPALAGATAPRKLPFSRRREAKANSLLRELLQQSNAFDVSKPYRLHSPPYSHSPLRGQSAQAHPPSSNGPKPESRKDSAEGSGSVCELAKSPEAVAEAGGSFSVRRSLRLASFPSRFAKRLRPIRSREGLGKDGAVTGGVTTETQPEQLTPCGAELSHSCCHHEKRACLCLPLHHKPTGRDSQFSSKAFEQTLSVDLCGTAGLTPPTTPPHKPVEDELFKPTEGGKASELTGESSGAEGGGGEAIHTAPHGGVVKGSPWLPRSHHQRKVPEQTELYAQLLRTAQTADGARNFGDHDYCAPSLGEKRKRSAAMLGAMFQVQAGDGGSALGPRAAEDLLVDAKVEEEERQVALSPAGETTEKETMLASSPPPSDCQMTEATPPSSEEEAEHSSASRSPSPILHHRPDFPASKTDPSENSEVCSDEKQRNKAKCDEDNCQVFYIHNLPSGVTQNMLRKRFQVFGKAEDCKIIICNEERCGVIKIRQPGLQRHWRDRDALFHGGLTGLKRMTRKRYIDLDEAGPGPIKSKYDAPDFDALLKEAQKTMQR